MEKIYRLFLVAFLSLRYFHAIFTSNLLTKRRLCAINRYTKEIRKLFRVAAIRGTTCREKRGSNVSHTHILIVEDSQSTATAIAKHLTEIGYAVTVINSLDEALHWLDTPGNLPDLLISDVQLARQNRHQLLRHVRTDPAALYPPVIFLSLKEDIGEKIASFAAGADDYLVKPVNPAELGMRARAVLTRTRAWRPAVIAALHR